MWLGRGDIDETPARSFNAGDLSNRPYQPVSQYFIAGAIKQQQHLIPNFTWKNGEGWIKWAFFGCGWRKSDRFCINERNWIKTKDREMISLYFKLCVLLVTELLRNVWKLWHSAGDRNLDEPEGHQDGEQKRKDNRPLAKKAESRSFWLSCVCERECHSDV